MPYIVNPALSPSTKIYRYMDLAKFLSLIHQRYLYFAKASSYEDRLEGMPTELDGYMAGDMPELLDLSLNSMWPTITPLTDEEVLKKGFATSAALDLVKNRTVNTILGAVRASDYPNDNSLFEAVSHWVDVSCWHTDESDSESMAMWKIYGAGSAAVCVESTLQDVISSMDIPEDRQVYAGKITYLDYKNDYVGGENFFGVFFQKSKFYDYEKELRVVIYPAGNTDPKTVRSEAGTKVNVDPKKLIKSVLVSPASSPWFHELIEKVLKEAGFTVPVLQSMIPIRPK